MSRSYIIELFKETKGYTVYIPAFDGWTQGRDFNDAIHMAKDYISNMEMMYKEMGKNIFSNVEHTSSVSGTNLEIHLDD